MSTVTALLGVVAVGSVVGGFSGLLFGFHAYEVAESHSWSWTIYRAGRKRQRARDEKVAEFIALGFAAATASEMADRQMAKDADKAMADLKAAGLS